MRQKARHLCRPNFRKSVFLSTTAKGYLCDEQKNVVTLGVFHFILY